MDMYDVFF